MLAELGEVSASCEAARAEQRELLDSQSARLDQQQQQLEQLSATLDTLATPQAPLAVEDCPAVMSAEDPAPGKLTVGRRETVWLEEPGLALPAR